MKKLLALSSLIAAISLFLILPAPAGAVTSSDWRAGRIIEDSVFVNYSTMTPEAIKNFIESKISACASGVTCLRNYYENTTTKENNLDGRSIPAGAVPAYQIIWQAAQDNRINPQVLLVTLEKETSLVTKADPGSWRFRTAMGYGCPDGGSCDSDYYGFYNQMDNAAWQFRRYLDYPQNYNYSVGQRYILWSPTSGCGGSNVNIETAGTAALYNYTPYQPNQASLNAYPGSGDGCSSYGNRNFWFLFNAWFPQYLASFSSQITYPSIRQTEKAYVFISYKNSGSAIWYDDTVVGQPHVHLATARPINRASALVEESWCNSIDRNRPTCYFDKVYESDGVTLAGNQHAAKPGQIVKFAFIVQATADTSPKTYREYFQPIVEGGSTMNDVGTYLDITVQSASYTSSYYSQSAYPTLKQGTSQSVYISYRNTGNTDWYDSAIPDHPHVHLSTSRQLDRGSPVSDGTWCSYRRPSCYFDKVYESDGLTLAGNQHAAKPGQIVSFRFNVTADPNLTTRTYREYFQPIVEGYSAMNDPGTFLDVRIVP